MRDIFDTVYNEDKESRNLKSWAVKLPEETIQEIEDLYKLSGMRYKNEFLENIMKEYKLKLAVERQEEQNLIHPEILKEVSRDIKEVEKIVNTLQSSYHSQIEKLSELQYQCDKLREENIQLKNTSSQTVINEYLLKKSKQKIRNRMYFGITGSGKSHALKLDIEKAVEEKRNVIIIDQTGEYKDITEQYGGTTIQLGKDRLNPFEFHQATDTNFTLVHKMLELYSFIEVLINRDLPSSEHQVLLGSLEKTYMNYGITRENSKRQTDFPTLKDLEKTLRMNKNGIALANELEIYSTGYLSCFNGERNVDIPKKSILTFDVSKINSEMKPAGMYCSLSYIFMMLRNHLLEDVLIIADEIGILSQNQNLKNIFESMLQFSKNKNTEFSLSTEDTEQFYQHLPEINTYMDTAIYFRQHQMNVKCIRRYSSLTGNQVDFLQNASYGESIVQIKNDFPFYMKYPSSR